MHQQVRCSIRRADAAFGRLDEESLVEILTLLQAMSLRSAGRVRPDDGGDEKFAFSVVHRPGDDTADQEACNILIGAGFEANVFRSSFATSPITGARFSRPSTRSRRSGASP